MEGWGLPFLLPKPQSPGGNPRCAGSVSVMPSGFLESQLLLTENHYSVTRADYIQILVSLLSAGLPQASDIASLCLSFLLCKMGIMAFTSSRCGEN